MARLEDLTRGASVKGIIPNGLVTVENIKWIGSAAVELIYKDTTGQLGSEGRQTYKAATSKAQRW